MGAAALGVAMRIVYIAEAFVPSRFANSVHVMKMCQALAGLGHQVTLLAARRPGDKDVDDPFAHYGVRPVFNLQRLPYPTHKGGSLVYSWQCAKAARQLRPEVLYGRASRGLFAAALLARPRHTVWETHLPPSDYPGLNRWMFRILERMGRLSHLVVISQCLKELVAPESRVRPIVVAHDGADLPPEGVAPVELPGHGFPVGYVGHLYQGRGVDLMLELARRVPGADFHLVGGTEEDLKAIQTRPLPPNLYLHGFVPPARVPAFQRACKVLLMPYERRVTVKGEGDTSRWMSPLKMFEYMGSGAAIIASNMLVLREVLRHDANALLAPPEDVGAWEAALRRLMDDPALAGGLAAAARADLEAHYTWDRRAALSLRPLR